MTTFRERTRFLNRSLAADIARIPPGASFRVSRSVLDCVAAPSGWTSAEWLMESIPGAAYNFRFFRDPLSGDVTFFRLAQPLKDGRYTYISPDRRDRVRQDRDGYYVPLGAPHA